MTKVKETDAPLQRSTETGLTMFVCTLAGAEVFLAGDFNNWNPQSHRMTRGKDGAFQRKLKLAPGSYEYKFIVDGEWRTDPRAAEQRPNEFGSMNSVIHV
jgi:5'-AMP-activated protein kinase regulatory beta subunit